MEVFGSVFSSVVRPPGHPFASVNSIRTIIIKKKKKGISIIKESKKCFLWLPKFRRSSTDSDIELVPEETDTVTGYESEIQDQTLSLASVDRADAELPSQEIQVSVTSVDEIELLTSQSECVTVEKESDRNKSVTIEIAKLGFASLNDPNFVRQVSKRFRKAYMQQCMEVNSKASILEVAKKVPGFYDAQKYYPALATNLCFTNAEMIILSQNGLTREDLENLGLFSQELDFKNISCTNTETSERKNADKCTKESDSICPIPSNGQREGSRLRRRVSFAESSLINPREKRNLNKILRRYSFSGPPKANHFQRKPSIPKNSYKNRSSQISSSCNMDSQLTREKLPRKLSIRSSKHLDYSCKRCPAFDEGLRFFPPLKESNEVKNETDGNFLSSSGEVTVSSLRRSASFTANPMLNQPRFRRSFSFSERMARPEFFGRKLNGKTSNTAVKWPLVFEDSEESDKWLNMPEEPLPPPALGKQMKTAVRTVSRKMSLTPKPPVDDFQPGVPPHLRYQLKEIYVY